MKQITLIILIILLTSQTQISQTNCRNDEIFKNKSCQGDDISNQEKDLYALINVYRKQNNLKEIPISESVCLLANRHVLDLIQNIGTISHSWSDCAYEPTDSKTFDCIFKAPKRFDPTFTGFAFENVYSTAGSLVNSKSALEAWKKSPLHNSLILNLNQFKTYEWNEGCVAIEGKFAALWFTSAGIVPPTSINTENKGLGVTFDEAVKDLTTILSINPVSSTINSEKWLGSSSDKSVVLEMFGNKEDIAEGKMLLRIKLQKDKTISEVNRNILQTFLKNLTPNWKFQNQWFDQAFANIKKSPTKTQLINIENTTIEMNLDADGFISLTIKPYQKPIPREFE